MLEIPLSTPQSVEDALRDFIAEQVAPHIDLWERNRTVPVWLLKELGQHGILAACGPGAEHGIANRLVLAETLGRTRSLGLSALVVNHLNMPTNLLHTLASEPVRKQYLEPSLQGDLLGAIGIAEQAGGSDLLGAVTTNLKVNSDGSFTLNGTKQFILNIPGADYAVVLARSADRTDVLGFSLVVVSLNSEGVDVTRLQTVCLHTAAIGTLTFRDCRIPGENLLGDLHKGFLYLNQALTEERLVGCASVLGLVHEVLTETLAYVGWRPFMQRKLGELPVTRHRLIGLMAEYEVAKALHTAACADWHAGSPLIHRKAAMVKLNTAEMAEKVLEGCSQLFGGRGFLTDNWITRAYRDVLGAAIFAGTSEVMKEIIADSLRL